MKAIVFSITDPADKDLIIIEYSDIRRGGVTSVKHRVRGAHQRAQTDEAGVVAAIENVPGETQRDIAKILANHIVKDWMPEAFEASVKDDTGQLVVKCTGLVPDVKFKAFVEGGGSTKIEMMEF